MLNGTTYIINQYKFNKIQATANLRHIKKYCVFILQQKIVQYNNLQYDKTAI